MTQGKLAFVALALIGLSACAGGPTARDRIVKRTPTCLDQTAQIYFEAFSADVTKEGRAVLSATARDRQYCRVTGVDILGLADAVGGDSASNLELSKQRAQAVTAALQASGLPAGEFKVSAAGQAGATTARGQAQPLRRRVDVVIHVAPL